MDPERIAVLLHLYNEMLQKHFGVRDEATLLWRNTLAEAVLQFLPSPPLRVIHLGCGRGELLFLLASMAMADNLATTERTSRGELFYGVCSSEGGLAEAKGYAGWQEIPAVFDRGTPGLPGQAFNLVITSDLGELAPRERWDEWLTESARLTTFQGHYLLFNIEQVDGDCLKMDHVLPHVLSKGVGVSWTRGIEPYGRYNLYVGVKRS